MTLKRLMSSKHETTIVLKVYICKIYGFRLKKTVATTNM